MGGLHGFIAEGMAGRVTGGVVRGTAAFDEEEWCDARAIAEDRVNVLGWALVVVGSAYSPSLPYPFKAPAVSPDTR
jgi:hypothetical protein